MQLEIPKLVNLQEIFAKPARLFQLELLLQEELNLKLKPRNCYHL
jgi:hypothetical protein